MPEPHITVFSHPSIGKLAAVVIDQDQFNDLCDELKDIFVANLNTRAADAQIASLKAAKTIPMIARGSQTEKFFQRFNIDQDQMSVIVRGAGEEVLDNFTRARQRYIERN